jgi:hypothetical protein
MVQTIEEKRELAVIRNAEYRRTEAGHKSRKTLDWKYSGIKLKDNEDWESVYYFVEATDNCESCNKVFTKSWDRHLDHCHDTGYIRDVVCNVCNSQRRVQDKKNRDQLSHYEQLKNFNNN